MKNNLSLLVLLIAAQFSQPLQASEASSSSSSSSSQSSQLLSKKDPGFFLGLNNKNKDQLPEDLQIYIFSFLFGESVKIKNIRSCLILNKLVNVPWLKDFGYNEPLDEKKWAGKKYNWIHPKTLLHRAVININVDRVKLLLSAGADPNKISPGFETTPRYGGSKELIKSSLYTRAVDDAQDEHEGSANSRTKAHKIAQLLLEAGADQIVPLKPLPSREQMDSDFNNPGW